MPYLDSKLPVEKRVKDLLSRMTPEEKAGQLNQLSGGSFTGPALNDAGQKQKMQLVKEGKVGSLLNVIGTENTGSIQEVAMQSRLRIPLLFAYDVIHGYRTIFPIPMAEACSWDLKIIEQTASIAAKETAAAGIHWTFAPMCDISNDPRWGRVMEGAGEDPYYAGLVAAARVKGFQGDLSGNDRILACVKHYTAYGLVEAGREYNSVDLSRLQLWNKYMEPYKTAIDAGAATVMNSFNVFEGIPTSGNKYLVNDVLKKKWGFKGLLVSDWGSFKEMVNHGYASDDKDAALKAIQAGSMMDMQSNISYVYLPQLLKEGKITLQQLDEAAGKVLYFKFKLGLFDDPFKYSNAEREKQTMLTESSRHIARKAGAASVVLLKNNNAVLPLKKNIKIALTGRYAGSKEDLLDFWKAQGTAEEAITVKEALEKKYGTQVSFCNGYAADNSTNETLIAEAVQNANGADVVVVNIGLSGKLAGEERSLAYPEIPAGQIELLKALRKTGKPVVALVSTGRPLVLTHAEPLVDAMVLCWILGTEHGNAVADILDGTINPSGKTVMSFPYAIGQIPVYYNHLNTNRPKPENEPADWTSRYRDIPNEPFYPFGYGLSYTRFDYSNLKLSSSLISKNGKIMVTVDVKNTGNREGEEVVQLYTRDFTASVVRPVKELKNFSKIKLAAGETKQVSFTLTPDQLSFYNSEGNKVLEPGRFAVMVGGNSKEVLTATFDLQ